ncbi:G-type lectin S-receptor-like serine/threonine-protein kinase At4g27290 isoform X1 [Carya illinoinensis]|uniref:Receptor-like serine/threonine-protein kinase n=2 Tax=Carya illinoinensis TaxID=32201 RepID=A0A8T1P0P8_CARIL|nr:G-type lectin S-receptor-like serine/threonine-protein kinase At4g27290 isoform X1 [Carya illinoinensis]KAG6634517.1 hypothetical protein CIPAW_12G123900 [Carya illinoinensis]
MEALAYLFVYSLLLSLLRSSITLDTITPSQPIRDGDTLVSADRSFQLGFFSPASSKSRYMGIWYLVSSEIVVWVANRDTPLNDHLGVLRITYEGVLVLLNSTNSTVWSSNTSRTPEIPVAQLLDTGNLVVKDGNFDDPGNFLWQSFDHPCDTLLPEMKLGKNLVTGLERFLSSWKSIEDPAQGVFSVRIDPRGLPQFVVMEGAAIKYRVGPWNGLTFSGNPALRPNPIFNYTFVLNENEVYYENSLLNSSVFSRFVLNPSGIAERFTWIDRTHSWQRFLAGQLDQCENYGFCGAYTTCNPNNSPICACFEGFEPKSERNWNSNDWSDGCVRRTPLECNDGDGFLKWTKLKLPDTSSSWYNKTTNLKECGGLCLKNCSCTAYSNLDVRGEGSGCLLWFGSLTDIRVFSEGGQELYLKLAKSELDRIEKKKQPSKIKQASIIGSVILVTGIIILGVIAYIRKNRLHSKGMSKRIDKKDWDNEGWNEDMELPTFDLTAIANATDNFSSNNKLGEGGFGPVYKGTLDGQVIAVKRLSKNSGQGSKEFKNEVQSIARLQHRNLVKLLGCCIQEDEKMLVYEYMPNKSLDFFIFDQTKSKLLDWLTRMNIIGGIARGLLYLHEDSRLRIIHRDLKASNILLDNNMNPKISDFGLARSFGGDEVECMTNRIVGTYGYMSPEYAVHGQYSIKSDVFSFGVLVLEIVSGKKNRGFCDPDHNLNLLGHAWRLWVEDRPMGLVDESVGESISQSEVLRCIQVGLLCVQHNPEDRPNMSSVLLMLSSESLLHKPRQPGFYTDSRRTDYSSSEHATYSANEISTTSFGPR